MKLTEPNNHTEAHLYNTMNLLEEVDEQCKESLAEGSLEGAKKIWLDKDGPGLLRAYEVAHFYAYRG